LSFHQNPSLADGVTVEGIESGGRQMRTKRRIPVAPAERNPSAFNLELKVRWRMRERRSGSSVQSLLSGMGKLVGGLVALGAAVKAAGHWFH
jgi:hypothetical protein